MLPVVNPKNHVVLIWGAPLLSKPTAGSHTPEKSHNQAKLVTKSDLPIQSSLRMERTAVRFCKGSPPFSKAKSVAMSLSFLLLLAVDPSPLNSWDVKKL